MGKGHAVAEGRTDSPRFYIDAQMQEAELQPIAGGTAAVFSARCGQVLRRLPPPHGGAAGQPAVQARRPHLRGVPDGRKEEIKRKRTHGRLLLRRRREATSKPRLPCIADRSNRESGCRSASTTLRALLVIVAVRHWRSSGAVRPTGCSRPESYPQVPVASAHRSFLGRPAAAVRFPNSRVAGCAARRRGPSGQDGTSFS